MKDDDKGLYQRGRRWWLRLYTPDKGKQYFPLVPVGQTRATTNKNVARVLARDIRKRVEGGTAAPAAEPLDLEELIGAFVAVNKLAGAPAQAKRNAAVVRAFIDAKGITDPVQFSAAAIQDYLADMAADGLKPKTVRNIRTGMSTFCRFLVDRDILPSNPCPRVRIAKLEKLPPRYLRPDEYHEVLRLAVKHGVYAEVGLALFAGLRREELRRLAWVDVDLDHGVIIVPKSKSRRPRQIPISKRAGALLRMQQKATGAATYVFPGQAARGHSGMRRSNWWTDALKPLQAAIPAFQDIAVGSTGRAWHLFRHTFASRLVQAGVPIVKVSAWLGHSSIQTTMIYAHLAPGHDADIDRA